MLKREQKQNCPANRSNRCFSDRIFKDETPLEENIKYKFHNKETARERTAQPGMWSITTKYQNTNTHNTIGNISLVFKHVNKALWFILLSGHHAKTITSKSRVRFIKNTFECTGGKGGNRGTWLTCRGDYWHNLGENCTFYFVKTLTSDLTHRS